MSIWAPHCGHGAWLVLWFRDRASDSGAGADVAGESLAVGGQCDLSWATFSA